MKNKGFTLIEILLVFAIICICMVIFVPQFAKVVHNLDSDNDGYITIPLNKADENDAIQQDEVKKINERTEGLKKL